MTDYNTLQKRRNYIVGAFVLIAFIAFVVMLNKFRDLPLFVSQYRSFLVMGKFTDAPGVQSETPVQFCGQPADVCGRSRLRQILARGQGHHGHR
jgi:hypothetical protein